MRKEKKKKRDHPLEKNQTQISPSIRRHLGMALPEVSEEYTERRRRKCEGKKKRFK